MTLSTAPQDIVSGSGSARHGERTDWMRALARHYGAACHRFPDRPLMIVFDIDGTILDMRFLLRHLLLAYDRAHGTRHFLDVRIEDLAPRDVEIRRFLVARGLDARVRDDVFDWCRRHFWSRPAALAAHRPHRGVLDVIRWFQLQPRVAVGLNTARPERLREDTLAVLNELGREYRVSFRDDLLFMNPDGFEHDVRGAKLAGLRFFAQAGYQVFAVVDDEIDNIEALAEADKDDAILFLHADTLFAERRTGAPRTVSGSEYDLTRLVSGARLPFHVQFAWHGVDDLATLDAFVPSSIAFAECDVRRDPFDRIVLRDAAFDDEPWRAEEAPLALESVLRRLHAAKKGAKLDLKVDADVIDRVLAIVARSGIPDERLWFNATLDVLGRDGFEKIARAHPGAILQCPVDFIEPLLPSMEDEAVAILERLRTWRVNRFSLGFARPRSRQVLARLLELGFDVNVYDVSDLESFLQAALLLPRSLTYAFSATTSRIMAASSAGASGPASSASIGST